MAAAVPVSDVLCEAMDYLSRLGSNLRTRTESLKDKRISKEKLRNAHAVRKAANKVLLICELSKKSIENVESGVKRVLTHICDDQASEIGGKTKREKSGNTKNEKNEYIVYKSRKLKMKKSVNVKHYMSAKVKATAMASDFQEKYPVYYDCELYRMRKRKSTILERSSKDEREENTPLPDCKEDNLSTKEDSVKAQPAANVITRTDEEPLTKPLEKPCELETKVSPENEVKSSIVESKGTSSKEKGNGDRQEKGMRKSKNNIDDTNTQSSESLEEEANSHKIKIKKRRLKRIKFFDDDSSGTDKETEEQNKEITKTKVPHPSLDECTVDKDNEISKKNNSSVTVGEINEELNKEITKTIVLQPSTDECTVDKDIEISKKNISTVTAGNMDENKSHSENKENSHTNDNPSKKTKLSSDNTVTEKEQEDKDSSAQRTGPEDEKTETKPLIKCVDISKLLSSPEKNKFSKAVDATLVEISDSDSEVKIVDCKISKTKDKDKIYRDKKGKSKSKRSKDKKSETRTDKDEEYWLQKRIEVKEFVPKEFKIKVVKLPKFTEEYLVTQNLKRITQNGKVLFECHMEPTADADKKAEQSKNVTASNDNVKNSLLNDSDSEKSDTEIIKKTKNAIETFLKSSSPTSDKERAPKESQSSGTLPDTEKQKTPEPNSGRKSDDETEIVKSSLMKDSSDENVKGSDKKRRKSDSITPSKRKHIMESMHAKKMLLTYSSSSETEDEQLKSTLREIRKSLLEETVDVSKKSTDSNKEDEKKKSKHDAEDSDKSEGVENGLSNNIEENSNSSTKKMSKPNSIVNGSSHNNSDTEDQIEKDIDG